MSFNIELNTNKKRLFFMKSKLLIILTGSLLFFLLGLVSCEKCGPFADKFKVVGLNFATMHSNYDVNKEWKLELSEIENDTIIYNAYSINISPRIIAFFSLNRNCQIFKLVNTAYACSPGILGTDERIDSIVITSQSDFSEDYAAGTDLSELFDVVVLDESNSIYFDKFKLSDYISTKPFVPNSMALILNRPPIKSKGFEFTVKYFQDGIDFDFFEFETEEVFIKVE